MFQVTFIFRLAVLVGLAPWASAAQVRVDLELVLAIDASSSADNREFELQARGLAQVFRDVTAIQAIQSGYFRRIAVTAVEWARADLQVVNIPWILVGGPEAAHRMAAALGSWDVISRLAQRLSWAHCSLPPICFRTTGFAAFIRSSICPVADAITRAQRCIWCVIFWSNVSSLLTVSPS